MPFRIRTQTSRLGVIAMAVALSACAASQPIPPGAINPAVSQELGQTNFAPSIAESYVLRPGDSVAVNVFGEEDISLESVLISADGLVAVPLIGEVQMAGRSSGEVGHEIAERLGERFLRDPRVAVNVLAYGSHLVTVEGSVETPGVYEFAPGTRLSGGLALAEGATRVSDLRDVAIFRETPDGMQVGRFDYVAVRAGQMVDPVLQPDDRIVVGTDNLSQFWQDLLRALPAFGLFTNL